MNIDEPLTRIKGTTVRHYVTDALGSVIGLADDTGVMKTTYTYDPFGNTTVSGEASDNPFQYTGRENDGTGLYYYRARYYSSDLQRFISEDPIGLKGGDVNFYAYVGNNPVNKFDPYGLKGKKCDDCDQCTVWCGCQLRVCACSENRCGKVRFLGLFTIDPLRGIVGICVFSCDEFYGDINSQPHL